MIWLLAYLVGLLVSWLPFARAWHRYDVIDDRPLSVLAGLCLAAVWPLMIPAYFVYLKVAEL